MNAAVELPLAVADDVYKPGPVYMAPAPVVQNTALGMLQAAIESGRDMATIEKLMELAERWEKREAEKAYVAAITQFKQHPPEIIKRKRVYFESTKGTVDYMHAELADVCEAAIQGLAMVGISHRWDILEQTPALVTVACVLTHVQGHSQRTVLSGPPDQSGSKNAMQAVGSAVTYLQRYTLLAATGLAAKGMDTDARASEGAGVERITREQVADLEALITEVGADRNKFLVWARVARIEDIEAQHYKAVITGLRAKAQSPNQKKAS